MGDLGDNVMISQEEEESLLNSINKGISLLSKKGKVSDGYHTFDELYEIRKAYNAALFNEWADAWHQRYMGITEGAMVPAKMVYPKYDVHKSWRHNDGELCFGGGWFIVVAKLPTGLISNHYKAEDWDLFRIPEVEKAKYEYDGHTGHDTIERLKAL